MPCLISSKRDKVEAHDGIVSVTSALETVCYGYTLMNHNDCITVDVGAFQYEIRKDAIEACLQQPVQKRERG